MSAAELQLIYAPDDEWLGEITATVRSGAFSGQSTAWFSRSSVKEQFVDRLRSFPLTLKNLPTFEGGWSKEGGIGQCYLRVAIRPHNSRGTLLVHVDLASPSERTPDADLQNSATLRFLTEYAAVEAFADDFEKVLDGVKGQAILKGIVN